MTKLAMTPDQIATAALAIADQLEKLWDQLQPTHNTIGDIRESEDASRDWSRIDWLTDDASIAIAAAENQLRAVAKLLSK